MTLRSDFLDAWQRYDRACETHSARHGAGATSETLRDVTARYVNMRRDFAAALGLGSTQLHDLLVAWRRAGKIHEAALRAVEAGVSDG